MENEELTSRKSVFCREIESLKEENERLKESICFYCQKEGLVFESDESAVEWFLDEYPYVDIRTLRDKD